jgi:hypothetical protein
MRTGTVPIDFPQMLLTQDQHVIGTFAVKRRPAGTALTAGDALAADTVLMGAYNKWLPTVTHSA